MQNRRVVLSDSESDIGDDSAESTDDAKVTKRSQSHLGSNTRPSLGHASNKPNDDYPSSASTNYGDDDLGDASGKSDDDTTSATSKKRDPSHCDSTIGSNIDTPSPIGGSKTVKRKADTWDIDPHNIMSPSSQAPNHSELSQNDGKHPGKHQRLTRGHGHSTVSYDMKHHPMDDVLRPKYSAKRRANGKQVPKECSDNDDGSDEDDTDNAPSAKVTSTNAHRRRSSRNIYQSETPIYSAKWHPLDQMLRDNASSTRVSRKHGENKEVRKNSGDSSSTLKDEEDSMNVESDLNSDQDVDRASELVGETASISPGQRRSARVSSSKGTPPNYDMKYDDPSHKQPLLRLTTCSRYHIMDSTLRPKASAKRLKSKVHSATTSKTLNKWASYAKTHTKQLAKASSKSLTRRSEHSEPELNGPSVPVAPAWSRLQNPYLNRNSLTWAEIEEMDRCIYLLQKGAPLDSKILPQDWNHVVKTTLFDEGIITLDELNSQEGTELLRTRYESVRLGLQNFFDSRPEPVNENNWTLLRSERFDVYDMKRGSRYWRHHKDSIVKGTNTSGISNILGYAAEAAEHVTENDNYRKATDRTTEEQDLNEPKTPVSTPHFQNEETSPSKSYLKREPGLEVDTERTRFADREYDDELGVITETEDTLVESMRGEQVHSSIMSDAALEELLFPVEQPFREGLNQEVTAGLVSSDSRTRELTGLVPIPPDKTLHGFNFLASEARATDLNTAADRGLANINPLGKEETIAGPRDGVGEPQTPKAEVKMRKRKSRVDVEIAVHEDLPGRTPLVKKIVGMNPASPGTDIPKENLADDGSVEHSSQVEVGTPRTHRHHEAIVTPNTGRVRYLGSATSASPPYRSLFGGLPGSSSPGSPPTTE